MQFIEWSQTMSVGSELLDGHHKMIIDCLNNLHPLIGAAGREAEIRDVLSRLENFVLVHFSEEEQCMKRIGYPDWASHKEQHDRMYDLVFGMKSELEHGRPLDAKHLYDIVYNWLIQHILGEDKKYTAYLEAPRKDAPGVWTRSNGRKF